MGWWEGISEAFNPITPSILSASSLLRAPFLGCLNVSRPYHIPVAEPHPQLPPCLGTVQVSPRRSSSHWQRHESVDMTSQDWGAFLGRGRAEIADTKM